MREQFKRIQHQWAAYSLDILPLLLFLLNFISTKELNAKEVDLADGFTLTGKFSSIKECWSQLTSICPKYDYFPKISKSYSIVKEDHTA